MENMMRPGYKNFRRFLIVTSILICAGCNSEAPNKNGTKPGPSPSAQTVNKPVDASPAPEAPTKSALVDIPGLANKSPEEIEKIVGKHLRVLMITEPPQEVPGEYRNYDVADMKDALTVRFYKGKAVAFTLDLPAGKDVNTPEELGKMTGFDLTGKTPAKATEFVSQWNGQFGPARFAEVTIGKTAKTGYNLVRARIEQ